MSFYEEGKILAKDLVDLGVTKTQYRKLFHALKQSGSAEEFEKRTKEAEGEKIEEDVEDAIGTLKGVVIYNAARGELVERGQRGQYEKRQDERGIEAGGRILEAINKYEEDFESVEKLMEYCTMFFTFYAASKKNKKLADLEKYL